MRPGGLYAVLRSRHINSLASQGSFTVAALRGTCFYPWRMKQVPCFTFHISCQILASILFLFLYKLIHNMFFSKLFFNIQQVHSFWQFTHSINSKL